MSSGSQTTPTKNDPLMSLEWFDNWDWQMGSSMADYFATPMGGMATDEADLETGGISVNGPQQQEQPIFVDVEGSGRSSGGGYMDIQLQL